MVSGGEDQVRHPACLRLPPLPTVLRSYGPTAYGPTVPTVPDQPSVRQERRVPSVLLRTTAQEGRRRRRRSHRTDAGR